MNKTQQPELVPAEIATAAIVPHQEAQGGASDAGALVRMALERGADVGTLERLVALAERERQHAARSAFYAAMSRFQSQMPRIAKTREVKRTGGGVMYKFANADDITAAIREHEAACGFSHRFEFQPGEKGGCTSTCIVTHLEGHEERTAVTIPPTVGQNTNAAQNTGIEMQYGMRYALLGAFGITTGQDDTDGRGITGVALSADQAAQVRLLCAQTGTLEAVLARVYGVESIEAIPATCMAGILATFAQKRKTTTARKEGATA